MLARPTSPAFLSPYPSPTDFTIRRASSIPTSLHFSNSPLFDPPPFLLLSLYPVKVAVSIHLV